MAATISYRTQLAPSTTTTHGHSISLDIQRLGRFAYAVLLLGVVLAVMIASVVRAERPQPDAWTAVTVQESGTLWALARAYPVDGLTTAETVDLIKESNDLDSAIITPGQALRVPAPEAEDTAVASR